MNKRYKGVTHLAFDLDGVIYTSEGFIAQAYEEAIRRGKLGLKKPTTRQVMAQIGKPIDIIFKELFPKITAGQMKVLHRLTLEAIREMIVADRGEIFKGIPEMLARLSKRFELAVCSNGRRLYVETVLSQYGLKKHFTKIQTLEDVQARTKGELLAYYIRAHKTGARQWLMVGDRRSDWEAAEFVGCGFIGCLWGHADREELASLARPGEAQVLLEEPEQLVKIL